MDYSGGSSLAELQDQGAAGPWAARDALALCRWRVNKASQTCGTAKLNFGYLPHISKNKKARWPSGHRAGVEVSERAESFRSYLMGLRQYSVFG